MSKDIMEMVDQLFPSHAVNGTFQPNWIVIRAILKRDLH